MPEDPVLTRIAFVVDPGARPGGEIRYVATCLNSGEWMPPISCEKRKAAEYWRKVFLLVALYLQRLRTHGPLNEWTLINEWPPLIHEVQTNYWYWSFLAKYWHEKQGTKGREVRSPEAEQLRRVQQALLSLFRPRGSRAISPWIAIGNNLPPESILICTGPLTIWPSQLHGKEPLPEDFFEAKRIRPNGELHAILRKLVQQVRDSEYAFRVSNRAKNGPLTRYRAVMQSQLPENILPLTLLEKPPSNFVAREESIRSLTPIIVSEFLTVAAQMRQRMLISGPSGAGKTTILRQVAKEYLEQNNTRPSNCHAILVNLNRFDPAIHSNFAELVLDSIQYQLLVVGASLNEEQKSSIQRWLNGKESMATSVLYLLDGYNEIPREYRYGPGRFEQQLKHFLRTCEGTVVVTTIDNEIPLCLLPRVYELQEPDDDAIKAFIDNELGLAHSAHFSDQVLTDLKYRSLSKCPFFLARLINLARTNSDSSALPSNRAAVLKAIIQDSVSRKFRQEEIQRPVPNLADPDLVAILSSLAHESLLHPNNQLTYPASLASQIVDPTTRMALARTAVLAGIIEQINFDETSIDQPIRFSHDLFRDYLAASYLNKRANSETINLRSHYLEHRRWDEPLCLFAELCVDKNLLSAQARDISESDINFACTFTLRGMCANAQIITQLVRGLGAILEPGFDAELSFKRLLPGRHIWNSDIHTTALLATLEDNELLELRAHLPKLSWLWCNAVSALGARGSRVFDRYVHESLFLDNREILLFLEGLLSDGSYDAFHCAVTLLRESDEGRMLAKQVRPDPSLGLIQVSHIFGMWPCSFSGEKLLSAISTLMPDNSYTFANMIANWRFQEQHIDDLLALAMSGGPYGGSGITTAIARIGGVKATEALLQYASWFLKTFGHESAYNGKYIHCFLGALRDSIHDASTLNRLRVIFGFPSHSNRESEKMSGSSRHNDELQCHLWNYFLLDILRHWYRASQIAPFFYTSPADDNLSNELRAIVADKVSFPAWSEAESALALLTCMREPEMTLELLEEFAATHCVDHITPPPLGTLPGSEQWPLWGLWYLDYLMEDIDRNATVDTIARCRRLADSDNLPWQARVRFSMALHHHGISVSAEHTLFAISSTAFGDGFTFGANEEIAMLAAGLSDEELVDITSRILKPGLVDRGESLSERDFAFQCQQAMRLLAGRERRYLNELRSLPAGLSRINPAYEPRGFQVFVRAMQRRRQVGKM